MTSPDEKNEVSDSGESDSTSQGEGGGFDSVQDDANAATDAPPVTSTEMKKSIAAFVESYRVLMTEVFATFY